MSKQSYSVDEVRMLKKKGRSKYSNQPKWVDGIRFASRRESEHYIMLASLEKRGSIRGLKLQQPYKLIVNEVLIATYYADFVWEERDKSGEEWRKVVADSKGVRTREYNLKKKLMRALHGIAIYEM